MFPQHLDNREELSELVPTAGAAPAAGVCKASRAGDYLGELNPRLQKGGEVELPTVANVLSLH